MIFGKIHTSVTQRLPNYLAEKTIAGKWASKVWHENPKQAGLALDGASALFYLSANITLLANNIASAHPVDATTILTATETVGAVGIMLSSALSYFYKQQKDYTFDEEHAQYIKGLYNGAFKYGFKPDDIEKYKEEFLNIYNFNYGIGLKLEKIISCENRLKEHFDDKIASCDPSEKAKYEFQKNYAHGLVMDVMLNIYYNPEVENFEKFEKSFHRKEMQRYVVADLGVGRTPYFPNVGGEEKTFLGHDIGDRSYAFDHKHMEIMLRAKEVSRQVKGKSKLTGHVAFTGGNGYFPDAVDVSDGKPSCYYYALFRQDPKKKMHGNRTEGFEFADEYFLKQLRISLKKRPLSEDDVGFVCDLFSDYINLSKKIQDFVVEATLNFKLDKKDLEREYKLAQAKQIWKKQLLKTFDPITSVFKDRKIRYLDEFMGFTFSLAASSAIAKGAVEFAHISKTDFLKVSEVLFKEARNTILGGAATMIWLMDASRKATVETFKDTVAYNSFKKITSSKMVKGFNVDPERVAEIVHDKMKGILCDKEGNPKSIGSLAFDVAGYSSVAAIGFGIAKTTYGFVSKDPVVQGYGIQMLIHGMASLGTNKFLSKYYVNMSKQQEIQGVAR